MHPLIKENCSLQSLNTFRLDVTARYLARFSSTEELRTLLADPISKKHKRLVLGGGSNLLFCGDYDGIVLKNEMRGIRFRSEDESFIYVEAMAGEVWHEFVLHCIDRDWSGLENLSLIPGSVGASPMQNIGAYGVEIQDVFHSLEAFHVDEGITKTFNAAECSFGYRESVFKRKEKDQWVILSVVFRLRKRAVFQIGYGAIQQELEKMNPDRLTIRDVSNAIIQIRRSKLPDPALLGNAGSFFKNPIVSQSHYESLKTSYPGIPCYPIDEHSVKVPAGWLIETAGWKGRKTGSCGVHDKQALVLVNYGGASGEEIYNLSESICLDIQSTFGIKLEREVNIVR